MVESDGAQVLLVLDRIDPAGPRARVARARIDEGDRLAAELLGLIEHRRGVGLLFLILCLLLSEFLAKLNMGAATDIIKEGLTICGWVAMWRPLEISLYDWWPLQKQIRLYQALCGSLIQVIQGK